MIIKPFLYTVMIWRVLSKLFVRNTTYVQTRCFARYRMKCPPRLTVILPHKLHMYTGRSTTAVHGSDDPNFGTVRSSEPCGTCTDFVCKACGGDSCCWYIVVVYIYVYCSCGGNGRNWLQCNNISDTSLLQHSRWFRKVKPTAGRTSFRVPSCSDVDPGGPPNRRRSSSSINPVTTHGYAAAAAAYTL